MKSDIVFKNGELVKNSSFFVIGRREILGTTAKVIPTDHIWAGPTHRSHPERNYGTVQNPIYYDGWIGGTEFSMLGRTPFLAFFIKNGIIDPLDPITFPYLTTEKVVFFAPA